MNLFEKKSLQFVDHQLKHITMGHLRILLPTSAEKIYGEIQQDPKVIKVGNYKFFTRLVQSGEIGLGEAWLENEWISDDLTGVLELFFRNQPLKKGKGLLFGFIGRLQYELQHAFGRHHAPKNPSSQMGYDLSNEFYQLYLDPETMLSSSAIFNSPEDSLPAAQQNKIKRIIELSDIAPDHHVLEIGCGRAGFAIQLAKTCGCRVTGTTTAEEEYRFARARVDEEGLSDLVSIELCETREIPGTFDRIIAIESLETVGRIDFNCFYTCCNRLLKPGGRVVQQVITIPDALRHHPTWLQKNIFPGGMIPSITELSKTITHHSELTINNLESIGMHYEETLRCWRSQFELNKKELVKLGYDGTFQRKWCYLLSYCEAAFRSGAMNNHHIVLSRPGEEGI